MNRSYEQRLQGGHPNSLGNTVEVVDEVLSDPSTFQELFQCYFSTDELVRLRTSNAMKRIAKADKAIVVPYLDRLLRDVSQIDQASAQWTLAQLFLLLQNKLSASQLGLAKQVLKRNLEQHTDWIVLTSTLATLGTWSKKDDALKEWLHPHILRLAADPRKSVAGRARKVGTSLGLNN